MVAIEEEGVDGISRTSGLHWRGCYIQEVLGASRRASEMPGVRIAPVVGTDTKHRY